MVKGVVRGISRYYIRDRDAERRGTNGKEYHRLYALGTNRGPGTCEIAELIAKLRSARLIYAAKAAFFSTILGTFKNFARRTRYDYGLAWDGVQVHLTMCLRVNIDHG